MENKESLLEIGDLVYLTCDTRRACLMTVAKTFSRSEIVEDKQVVSIYAISVLFLDKNNIPQCIENMDVVCIKKLMIS